MKLFRFFPALWQVVIFLALRYSHCTGYACQREYLTLAWDDPFAPVQLLISEARCPVARRTGLCL